MEERGGMGGMEGMEVMEGFFTSKLGSLSC